jgi:hypothetical protein
MAHLPLGHELKQFLTSRALSQGRGARGALIPDVRAQVKSLVITVGHQLRELAVWMADALALLSPALADVGDGLARTFVRLGRWYHAAPSVSNNSILMRHHLINA